MHPPGHIIAVLAYCLVALGVAVMLPERIEGLAPAQAAALGAIVLLGGAVVFEAAARRRAQAGHDSDIAELRDSYVMVLEELRRARAEAGKIVKAVEAASPERRDARSVEADVDRVVAEVKLLQTVVDQMSSRFNALTTPHPPAKPDLRVVAQDARAEPPQAETREEPAAAAGLGDDEILALVRDAVQRDRVSLVLQPIVSLPQRKHCYYEAFTRIHIEGGGVLTPEQYVALAEREGLISAIDNLLLFRCIQLLRRAKRQRSNLAFFCNISPHSISDRQFFREFVDFIGENAEMAPDLVFELSQATVAAKDEEIDRHLRYLATLGCRFSMDQVANTRFDFADLAERRFKFVKIDAATLLREMETRSGEIDPMDLKPRLDRYGIDLIAEKIETDRELLDLLDLGIDYGQGFLFGEPRMSRSA